jgi:hypothetical protein
VKDIVDALRGAPDTLCVCEINLVQLHPVRNRGEVLLQARFKVIENPDAVATLNKGVNKMRSDEPRSAGDKKTCQVLVEILLGVLGAPYYWTLANQAMTHKMPSCRVYLE